jgi:uncharacterized membrane protein YkoI
MKMRDYIHSFSRYLVVEIETPMYIHEDSDIVRINEKYIKQATQNCQYLVIRTPNAEKVFMPKALKKVGKKVKEVFLYPDNPMIMYEVSLPHCDKEEMDKWRWT